MSPEYAMEGHFSTKSDVFSFGVLILEIVSGKRNRGSFNTSNKMNLLGQVSTICDIFKTFKVILILYIQQNTSHTLTVNFILVLVSLNNCICDENNIFRHGRYGTKATL